MTDNEIIKALECCCDVTRYSCIERCDLYDSVVDCSVLLKNEALSLINRQKAEIDELQHKNSELEIELKAMRGAANSYKAEVERLKDKVNLILKYDKRRDINLQARLIDEATKECADRLKQQIKEMVGDDNG